MVCPEHCAKILTLAEKIVQRLGDHWPHIVHFQQFFDARRHDRIEGAEMLGEILRRRFANVANAEDAREIRTPPSAFDFSEAEGAGAGTSGVAGIQTIVLKGDPTKHGLYTILLRVPAHTKIAAHHHPDDRIATVVSGTWYFGYGRRG